VSRAASRVRPEQRFSESRPCPVCGGHANKQRGIGERCTGFLSEGGEWARCSREEHAGDARFDEKSSAFVHKLKGACKCGARHDLAEAGPERNGSGRTEGKKRANKREEKQEKTYTTAQVYDRPVYEFRNLADEVVYVQRHKGAYYRRVGEDRWVANLDGIEKLPYNLPGLIEGLRTNKTVFHTEGCKDADTATERLGVPATTTGGAKTWRPEYRVFYQGADVVVLPDNDAEGLEYAHRVAADVVGVARSVKIVRLSGLPEKGDLTDFLEAGGTPEQVFGAIESAPYYSAEDADDVSNASNVGDSQGFRDLKDLADPDAFPLEALPPTVGEFAREAAKSVGCPVDYVGISVLAALSAAIGGTRRLAIKRDWSEGAALYAMIVGGPASKKSPAMNLALKPVREHQMALKAEYDRRKEEYEIELANWKKAENADPADKPKKPVMGRTYADDTTVERLADILNENPRGLLITKDELSGWLGGMNAYKQGGKGADRQFWLSAHTNQPIAVDRKSLDEPVIVARPFVSIVGGIQPEVLPDFGKERGDGLIDRFVAAYPEPQFSR
jgi:hypothetical protein